MSGRWCSETGSQELGCAGAVDGVVDGAAGGELVERRQLVV
jgi:hypothetical protein